MILKKADVVSHLDGNGTRQTIYSLDFQPNSKRLATCGGGMSIFHFALYTSDAIVDATVKIWNLNCLSDAASCKEALLATLSTHSKPVNIVRWSRDGRVLASGSDDNYVLIHKYSPGGYAHSTFGSGSTNVKNKENWVRCCTLQGHTMDVLDLDWSPNGLLASGSVDNLIMIWNVGYALLNNKAIISPYRILSGHYSFVKGVSFDPIGQYLVSCGADNLILVWHCEPVDGVVTMTSKSKSRGPVEEWSVVKELSAPMKNCADKGMYRRIHWSADGQTVCVSSCVKSGKPVGMVLKRGTWEVAADLVGHAAATASCRYCPYILHVLTPPETPVVPVIAPTPAPVVVTPIVMPTPPEPLQKVSSEVMSEASTSTSTVSTAVKPEKSSAEKPERKKRRVSYEGSEEKRYSTSSADRSKRQAAKAEQQETELMSREDRQQKIEQTIDSQDSLSTESNTISPSDDHQPATEVVKSVPSMSSSAVVVAPSTPPRPIEDVMPVASPPKTTSTSMTSPSEASVDVSANLFSSTEQSTLLALGDQSGVLSLWAAHDTRPLAVIRGLFEGAITDIAWMRYGCAKTSSPGDVHYSRLMLACCSIDGHLALLDLPGERFTAFDHNEMETHCRELYCETSSASSASTAHPSMGNDVYGVQMNAFMPSSSSVVGSILVGLSGAELIKHQIETLTVAKNGKKRIKPVQIEEQAPAASAESSEATPVVKGSEGNAKEEVEWCWNGGALHKDAVNGSSQPQGRSNVSHYHSSSYREPVHLQPTSHRNTNANRSPESSSDARKRIRFSEQHQYHLYPPPDSMSSHSRDSANGRGSSSSAGGPVINDLNSMVRRKSGATGTSGYAYPPPPSAPVVVNRTITIRYDESNTVCTIPIASETGIESAIKVASGDLKVSCMNHKTKMTSTMVLTSASGNEVWSVEQPVRDVTVLTGVTRDTESNESGLILGGCADGSVVLIDLQSGKLVMPPLIVGSAVAFCDILPPDNLMVGYRVLVATSLGDVFLWSFCFDTSRISIVVRTSLRSVVFSVHCRIKIGTLDNLNAKADKNSVEIQKCSLNATGQIVAVVKSDDCESGSFIFREDAQAWSRLLV